MAQAHTHAFESESGGRSHPGGRGPYELPDALAGFPSEAAPETILDEHVLSPLVEPSEADRQRLFPPPQPIRIPVARLSRAAGMILVTLVGAFILATVVLGGLIPAFNPSSSDAPPATLSPAPPPVVPTPTTPSQTPAAIVSPPPQTPPSRDVIVEHKTEPFTPPDPPKTTAAPTARQTPPPKQTVAPRQTTAPVNDDAPSWAAASALARPTPSASPTPRETDAGRTNITPPAPPPVTSAVEPRASVPSPTATPPATKSVETPTPSATPSATPTAATSEAAARAARTAAVQSVIDRYRDAFDSLDANAVEGFWPSADIRALNRAFAQLETQRFQFDRCDIQLAGARAIASCNGSAQFVRKAGSRDGRTESRQWTFTLAEAKERWVILSVDARPVR